MQHLAAKRKYRSLPARAEWVKSDLLFEGSREYCDLKLKPERMLPSDDSAAVPFGTTVSVRAAALTAAFSVEAFPLRATVCTCPTCPTACALASPASRLVEVGFAFA